MKSIEYRGEVVEVPEDIGTNDLWISNVRAGFDPLANRYRTVNGVLTTLEKIRSSQAPPNMTLGGMVSTGMVTTPWSDAWSNLEQALGGVSLGEIEKVTKRIKESADPMPRAIQAEMKRSEHFFWQEGDIAQSFIVPFELVLQNVWVESETSSELADLVNLAYGADIGIDIRYVFYEMLMCAAIFGQAFPVELWEEKGKNKYPIPESIIQLNPKDVRVGQRTGKDNFSLQLPPPGGKWKPEHIHQIQQIDVVLQDGWKNQTDQHKPVTIKESYCRPFRWHALPFQRYSHPPLASMFRPITTRVLVEEARRSTIEGFKNQLWLVQVGDFEHRGTEAEITYMRTQLNSLKGLRNWTLLWNGNATIKNFAPEMLSPMMDDTLWLSITLDIMRRRGISLSLISGESPARGAGGGDVDVDVRMMLMRLTWLRNLLLRWEAGLKRKIVMADVTAGNFWQRKAAMKEVLTTHIRPTPEEIKHTIEEHLRPLVGIGKISDTTLLRAVNLNWKTELANKIREWPHRELFTPPVTFTQSVEKDDGNKQTSSPDRQQPSTERNRLTLQKQAASTSFGQESEVPQYPTRTDLDKAFREWLAFAWALAAFEAEVGTERLRQLNEEYMARVAEIGYRYMDGEQALDPAWVKRGVDWLNSYVTNLELDWDEMTPNRLRWRLGLYAQEGTRIGYVMGAQAAAKEVWGATHWQRVLRPELSEAGPCIQCEEDAAHLHSIDEPFFEFHPNGVCGMQLVDFFTPDIPDASFRQIEVPIF